jgi:hypothetical protein
MLELCKMSENWVHSNLTLLRLYRASPANAETSAARHRRIDARLAAARPALHHQMCSNRRSKQSGKKFKFFKMAATLTTHFDRLHSSHLAVSWLARSAQSHVYCFSKFRYFLAAAQLLFGGTAA